MGQELHGNPFALISVQLLGDNEDIGGSRVGEKRSRFSLPFYAACFFTAAQIIKKQSNQLFSRENNLGYNCRLRRWGVKEEKHNNRPLRYCFPF